MNSKLQQITFPLIDALLFAVAFILAYSLRFGLSIPSDDSLMAGANYALQLKLLLPWVVLTHVAIYWVFHLYRGIWRYAGFKELQGLGLACLIHFAFWALLNFFLNAQERFFQMPQRLLEDGETTQVLRIPWIIVVVYTLLAASFTGGLRLMPRLLHERSARTNGGGAPPTLIVGAGDMADSLLRSLMRQGHRDFRPICAVAEVVSRVGLRLQGIPVVGTIDKIPKVIEENNIRQVLVALDEPTPERLRRVVAACEQAEVNFRLVPSMKDISEGRVAVSSTRPVQIEDLLGREPVRLELPSSRNYLRGESVLITGAGGSIGSEMARQIAECGPGALGLLGKGENSLFEIAEELKRHFPNLRAEAVVGDIRDAARMEHIFAQWRPAVVFHAAAHKHVPLMERAAEEAVKNNIIGTWNAVRLSDQFGVKRFVHVSTDKAVRPVSVMGATKRFAEMIVFAMAPRSETTFVAVRFGNVLGSRGSVIPLFRRQIEDGGPVTVTHQDVTRYFMTIPEAVNLVLQAGSREEDGTLYLLDMGEPIRILDLARNMITLSGLRPDSDISIKFVGLRPGEKLTEELFTEYEKASQTDIEKLLVSAPPPSRSWDEIEEIVHELGENAEDGVNEEIIRQLAELIDDYHPETVEGRQAVASEPAALPLENTPVEPPEEVVAPGRKGEEKITEIDLFEGETESSAQDEDEEEQREEEEKEGFFTSPDIFEETFGGQPKSEEEPGAGPEDAELDEEMEPEEEVLLAQTDVDEDRFEEDQDAEPSPLPKEEEPEEEESEEELAEKISGEAVEETSGKKSDFPVETATVQMDAGGPLQEDPAQEPISSQEDQPTMKNHQACLLLKVSPGIERDTLGMLIGQMNEKILREGDRIICLVDEQSVKAVPEDVERIELAGEPMGASVAKALDKASDCGILITLSSEVLLRENALGKIAEGLSGDKPLVYSNFEENRDGDVNLVKPHDHEGCPHERFEFGPLIAYDIEAIRSVGGVRGDLRYAWEYDLHLKLMEKAPFKCLRETLYTVFLPSQKGGKGSAVYSPGMGPLGGFSYVFYPEDMENEVTSVFEEALKRRNAWIDHPTIEVDHSGKNYEVMVSVVTPILNRVKYIGNAIEKLQVQTYDDWEYIVVDNGSTDGTIEKVKSFAENDSRIRLVHGSGGSIASALNEGIKAARGKYIGQLDSDDEYAPECIEEMVKKLESNPKCGLAISYYRLMDADGKIIEDINPVTHKGYTRNQILRRDGAGATRYFAKAVLEKFGYYDEEHYGNFGEDYDMVVKTGEWYDVERVPKVLYHYRRHEDNTDVTRDPEVKYKNKNRARQEALRRRIQINKELGKA